MFVCSDETVVAGSVLEARAFHMPEEEPEGPKGKTGAVNKGSSVEAVEITGLGGNAGG